MLHRALKRALAAALASSLVALAPGLGGYEAFAQVVGARPLSAPVELGPLAPAEGTPLGSLDAPIEVPALAPALASGLPMEALPALEASSSARPLAATASAARRELPAGICSRALPQSALPRSLSRSLPRRPDDPEAGSRFSTLYDITLGRPANDDVEAAEGSAWPELGARRPVPALVGLPAAPEAARSARCAFLKDVWQGAKWGAAFLPVNLLADLLFEGLDQKLGLGAHGLVQGHLAATVVAAAFLNVLLPMIGVVYLVRAAAGKRLAKVTHRQWILGAVALAAAQFLIVGPEALFLPVLKGALLYVFLPLGPLAAVVLTVGSETVIDAFSEEVTMRYGLFSWLKRRFEAARLSPRLGLGLAAALSATAFMLLHFPFHGAQFTGGFLWLSMGVLFALIYHRTRSLTAVTAAHAAYNLLVETLDPLQALLLAALIGLVALKGHLSRRAPATIQVSSAGRAASAQTPPGKEKRTASKLLRGLVSASKAEASERAKIEKKAFASAEGLLQGFEPLFMRPTSEEGTRLAALYPELAGYYRQAPENASFDHEAAAPNRALVEHVYSRAVGRKLLGLEKGDRGLFQSEPGVSQAAFDEDRSRLKSIEAFLPRFRAALLFHDVAKGAEDAFADQLSRRAIDLRLSNKAGAELLRLKRYPHSAAEGLFENSAAFKKSRTLDEFAYQLIEMRGLPGQFLRGEATLAVLEPYERWVREHGVELARELAAGKVEDVPRAVASAHYLFNLIDTAAVREGLVTDDLRLRLSRFFEHFEGRLASAEPPAASAAGSDAERELLAARFSLLRAGRIERGEDAGYLLDVLRALPDEDVARLGRLMEHFQGWYVENATSGLSPESQVKLLALSSALAERKGVDVSKPYHIHFLAMMRNVASSRGEFDPYKTRLMEAVLRSVSLPEILRGEGLERFDLDRHPESPLGALDLSVDGERAVSVDFRLSPVAEGLVHVLRFMETKDAVAYHVALKQLLDLFGIRRDDFDRVGNEADYLAAMAAAGSDKAKLLPYSIGTVVEVGPAGGAILLLLEGARRGGAPIGKIVGLDVSSEALKDLEAVRRRIGADWELVQGDAFELKKVLAERALGPVDTIVLSSVLHEIYSYSEKDGPRFRLESVRRLLGEALSALAPGGKLVIRDWPAPPEGGRRQILTIKDKPTWELLEAFRRNFEGRPFAYKVLSNRLSEGGSAAIELSRADAMEFLFHLSWCFRDGRYKPDSFPYEVREQYGVLTRAGMLELLGLAAQERGLRIAETPVPGKDASYLQPGYEANLRPHAELFDLDGAPSPYPDDKMLVVVERLR